jgi:hypothetical protein
MNAITPMNWAIHPGWFAAIAILLWATNLLPELQAQSGWRDRYIHQYDGR